MDGGFAGVILQLSLTNQRSANNQIGQDLRLDIALEAEQLLVIQSYLEGLLSALLALTDCDQEVWQRAVKALGLDSSQLMNPVPSVDLANAPDLTLENARSLVLILGRLASQYPEILRRAVTLMEQMQEQGKDPAKTALLGAYLEKFWPRYHQARRRLGLTEIETSVSLPFKYLIDLLFCSHPAGPHWLWSALLSSTSEGD